MVLGPKGFTNSDVWQDATLGLVVAAMLAGPSIAGLLMTGLIDGSTGLIKLLSRLFKWRVGGRWYAIALLIAPLLSLTALFCLSISSPVFLAANKLAIVVPGIVAGLTTVFEEIGWTGFAIPRLRRRFSVFKTGLIVGIIWGLWHLLQQIYIGGTYAGEIPLVLYFASAIFNTIAGLTAYRILLVWLYDHTESLLVTTLMHASLTASNVFIFRPEATGLAFLLFGFLFTALQWVAVLAVVIIDKKRLLEA